MEIDRTICVGSIPGVEGPYGYYPSLGAGIAFCVLFGISMLLHAFTSARYRTWWQLIFAIGALGEVIGWAGRTWSSECPYQTTPFLIQICTLILAPAFFTAGIYVILGRLIVTFGRHVSPLSPNAYLYIFCTADIVSLVVQAVGGGMASFAYQQTPPRDTETGTHIMVAGILFQLAAIIVFSFLFARVIVKALKSRGEVLRQREIQYIIAATTFSVVVIVTRSIYRTIELLQGWEGYLITTERFFLALDGAMMVLAVAAFNIARPGWAEAGKSDRSSC
ncbi:hypothetical protein V500_00771 [Pseudogymnoascus sp. VKM F-4518 (FW-2643)]|nr:hypothetical protein V500_00771 [Pseudogymnoascus sp. VKM F-4518 (FW-2643)]